jgi:Ca-activated chloride channel family protein
MGAGHAVTALYEIIPTGTTADVDVASASKMRYQRVASLPRGARRDELMYVNVRYKLPDARSSRLLQQAVPNQLTTTDADFSFALAVASYGMLLRESPFRGTATLDRVVSLARDGLGRDGDGYRDGFLKLVETTRSLEGFRVGSRDR